MEKIGHLCDYVLWDEAWIGYNAFHPLFDGSQSDAPASNSGPDIAGPVLDAVGAQARRRLLAGIPDPQARRAYPRPAPLHRAQALQRIVPDARLDLAVLSAVRLARRQREGTRGQGRRSAVGPLHRAGHRDAQEAARVAAGISSTTARAAKSSGSSIRSSRRSHDPRLALRRRTSRTSAGRTCRPTSSNASSNAGLSIRRAPGTATRATRRARRWWIRTSSCC